MDVEKLFSNLESYDLQKYEDTKKKLTELFSQTKEQWLVQGMLDYYLITNSLRIIDILVKAQPPHDIFIFDRLSDWLRGGQNRTPSLNVFSFIVRKHPTWLYKIAKHRLMKDILKLLQTEKEIIPLMNALLSIIALLPIIPSLVPNFLSDLFEVFGHLASWNCQNPNKLNENQLIHLQIGLYMLFHRLYGMYPCHFISYLREFKDKEKGAIFHHTIKPLLETVRMHPLLVTATKESEVNNIRWKEMEPHDVVVECAKLSLDYYQDNSECFASVALRSQESYSSGCNNEIPISSQLQASLRDTQFQQAATITPSFYSQIQHQSTITTASETIWSPSIDILATPQSTGTVPHTPTPSYVGVPLVSSSSSAAVVVTSSSSNLLGPTGASPPEAAVEATPETTPMKDINVKRVMASNSPVIRAILPSSSQPSSPMRKEQSPFNFPESLSSTAALQRRNDDTGNRGVQQRQLIGQLSLPSESFAIEEPQPHKTTFVNKFVTSSSSTVPGAHFQSLDSPTNFTESTTQDEQETTTSQQQVGGNGGPRHSDTLQDISNEYGEEDVDDDETERSPCSNGGLHVPTNRSMQIFAQCLRRNRLASYCYNDTSSYLSYGTSPADVVNPDDVNYDDDMKLLKNARVRRCKSWHAIERYGSPLLSSMIDENNHQEIQQQQQQQNGGDSSSPSGDDAISAATHFKKLQQKQEKKLLYNQQKQIQSFNNTFRYYQHHYNNRNNRSNCQKIDTETQTVQQWPPQIYEFNLFDLFSEDNRLRLKFSSSASSTAAAIALASEMNRTTTTQQQQTITTLHQPQQLQQLSSEVILEQYIERTIKMKQHSTTIMQQQDTTNANTTTTTTQTPITTISTTTIGKRSSISNNDELFKDQIQLLKLQLQFERYRREIHAERNRRLLGKNRELRSLQMDNDRLKDQLLKLQDELYKLIKQCDTLRHSYNEKEYNQQQELQNYKLKYHQELDDNKKLRLTIEQLQRRLNDELKQKRELNDKIDVLNGEIFDLRNDMQQAQHQAELGTQYRLELIKLESEFLLMGENQIKCRDKLIELDTQKAKDYEISHIQEAYSDELKELRNILETKSAQLDAARHKLNEIQSQLSNKEVMFTDQKRLLKSVKEEYEEKFKALNNKYEVQKAIILSMEQTIFELYKNQSTESLATFSSESDKTDVAGSVDHASSPLSVSLNSSEGLSASLRSFPELRNLQTLVVQPTSTITNTATGVNTTTINSNLSSVSNLSQHHYHQRQLTSGNTPTNTLQASQQQHQQFLRHGSSNIHYSSVFPSNQQQLISSMSTGLPLSTSSSSSSASLIARNTRTSSVPNTSHTITSQSSSSSSSRNIISNTRSTSSPFSPSGTRHSASSPDIPVPGPSQHHSNIRHHR